MPTTNPAAILKSLQEQYNYLLATGVTEPRAYLQLQRGMDSFVRQWEQELAQGTGIRGFGTETAQDFIRYAQVLSRRFADGARNAELGGLARTRDSYAAAQGGSKDDLTRELYELISEKGVPLEEAVRIMMESGQYDLTEVQEVAYRVGNPDFDPSTLTPDEMEPGEGETGLPDPGFGDDDFKPNEPVAQDLTTPQEEFQKAFSQFTRGLETSLQGKSPQIAALSERYQDLFNSYLGEIEARKTRGEEGENVFKEEFANIGKSTDPQFDQETDRFQLRTVRPVLSAFDFLLKNVDPEDVYASTEFDRRPGRSVGGFRGLIRRLNR